MKSFKILLVLLLLCVPVAFAQKKKSAPSPTIQTTQKDCAPKFTPAKVRAFLYGKIIREIPYTNTDVVTSEGDWIFQKKEIIEVDIIETIFQGKQTIVVAQIRTGDAPGALNLAYHGSNPEPYRPVSTLEGRVRLTFEDVAGEQTLLKIENLSVKYTLIEQTVTETRNP